MEKSVKQHFFPLKKTTMKKLNNSIYSLVLISFVLIFASCNKNGDRLDSDLTVNFQMKVNGANFGIGDSYENPDGAQIKYETFQFYLSDIQIVNSDGEQRLMSEIALFKFNGDGLASIDFKVPHGQYNSVTFGIGVKKSLNEADPSVYAIDGHPLNITENTYWGWTSKYRFVMSEGRYDAENDGIYEGTFVYHTGYESSYRTLSLNKDFKIKKKDDHELNFTVDIYQFLDKAGNRVNPLETPFYHGSTEDLYITEKLSDNMQGAISLD